jgi:diacylglycerol O-acyltransferase / wax synthase
VPVAVPDIADPVARLQWILRRTQQAKSAQRGSSAMVLSWMFRMLATLRVGQWFVDHQRLVHTFETNLRGPAEVLRLAGARVEQIVPIAVNPGNVGLSFDVLSYAGDLTVALVADPGVVPEIAAVAQMLGEELATLTGTS